MHGVLVFGHCLGRFRQRAILAEQAVDIGRDVLLLLLADAAMSEERHRRRHVFHARLPAREIIALVCHAAFKAMAGETHVEQRLLARRVGKQDVALPCRQIGPVDLALFQREVLVRRLIGAKRHAAGLAIGEAHRFDAQFIVARRQIFHDEMPIAARLHVHGHFRLEILRGDEGAAKRRAIGALDHARDRGGLRRGGERENRRREREPSQHGSHDVSPRCLFDARMRRNGRPRKAGPIALAPTRLYHSGNKFAGGHA